MHIERTSLPKPFPTCGVSVRFSTGDKHSPYGLSMASENPGSQAIYEQPRAFPAKGSRDDAGLFHHVVTYSGSIDG